MISHSQEKHVTTAINKAISKTTNVHSRHAAVISKNGKFICSATNTETYHAEIACLKLALIKGS